MSLPRLLKMQVELEGVESLINRVKKEGVNNQSIDTLCVIMDYLEKYKNLLEENVGKIF